MLTKLALFRRKHEKNVNILEKQTNEAFNSKDILNIIASYIIPPLFRKRDWNTFNRLCRNTYKIGGSWKNAKAALFKVDMVKFEKERFVRETTHKLKSASSLQKEMENRKTIDRAGWKKSLLNISNVMDGNMPYFRTHITFKSDGHLIDALGVILDDMFNSFGEKQFSLFAKSPSEWKCLTEKISKNSKIKHFNENDIPAIGGNGNIYRYLKGNNPIDPIVFTDSRGSTLVIVVSNLTHQRVTLDNILKASEKGKKYDISYFCPTEITVVYDIISTNLDLSRHVNFKLANK